MILTDNRFEDLLDRRATHPEQIAEAAQARVRRPLIKEDGKLMIVAVDHAARRILGVGGDSYAIAARRDMLDRTIRALRRPGVDGLLATPDMVDDLLLLGELDDKVVFGSMNRGGLTGSAWELDDRFTAYNVASIMAGHLDGGKMLLRIDYSDAATNPTLEACANAITELAANQTVAMLEPLPAVTEPDGRVRVTDDMDRVVETVAIATALGASSAYTWLKLPTVEDPERMMAATTLPALLLGGDPTGREDLLRERWRRSMEIPNVRGLMAGRSLLFPGDGNVEKAVDTAVEIVHAT